MPLESEIAVKRARLAEFLDRHGLDGVLLQERGNFAWITGGADNHVPNDTSLGVASLLATVEDAVCLANVIEAPRMEDEELRGSGIDVVSFPWWDPSAARRTFRHVIDARAVACDRDPFGLGLPRLPPDFAELRWSLTDEEISRYREGARRLSGAVERTALEIPHGMSEHEAAGLLDQHVRAAGLNPTVTLVGADERIERYRHPIPTGRSVERYVMLVTCASFGGLISCMTRFVHFGEPPPELRRRHRAVCNVDAAVILATRPGRSLGTIFGTLQRAYAENGFGDEWERHHQGGSTGYANREVIATPDSRETVRENQAFAWNPSITGVKSEDTLLSSATEILTATSGSWPRVEARVDGVTLPRPGILVR